MQTIYENARCAIQMKFSHVSCGVFFCVDVFSLFFCCHAYSIDFSNNYHFISQELHLFNHSTFSNVLMFIHLHGFTFRYLKFKKNTYQPKWLFAMHCWLINWKATHLCGKKPTSFDLLRPWVQRHNYERNTSIHLFVCLCMNLCDTFRFSYDFSATRMLK